MTNEYKNKLIEYVTGLLTIEQEQPTEFDPLEPIGTMDIDYNDGAWNIVTSALSGKSAYINGILEKPSSVILFNRISYTEKSYKQKKTPVDDSLLPDFLNNIPY